MSSQPTVPASRPWIYGNAADKRTAKSELKVIQDDRCAACLRRLPDPQLYVDHDHATGYVRGLLCAGCNVREAANGPYWQVYIDQPPATLTRAECLREFLQRAEIEFFDAQAAAEAYWPDALARAIKYSSRKQGGREASEVERRVSELALAEYDRLQPLIKRLTGSLAVTVTCSDPEALGALGITLESLRPRMMPDPAMEIPDWIYMSIRQRFEREIAEAKAEELRAASTDLMPHEFLRVADDMCGFPGCPFKYDWHPRDVAAAAGRLKIAGENLGGLRSANQQVAA